MNRRQMLKLAMVWCVLGIACTTYAASPKPNIVVIFTDDQGYADLGCQDILKDIETPNIDSLAANGLRCTNGYVTASQCTPSRGGILSGKYQQRFGMEFNSAEAFVPREHPLIAERLKAAGYYCGMSGKWHVGKAKPYQPSARGFDEYFCMLGTHTYIASHDLDSSPLADDKQMLNFKRDKDRIDLQSQAAVNFIERNAGKDKPFFLYYAPYAPHVPLVSTEKYLSRFPDAKDVKRKTCLALMSSVDDGVGQLLASLRKHKIEENTLIFFISDNGAPMNAGWNGSMNTPLHGHKGTLYEGGIRIPYIIQWKGTVPAGKLYHQPVISLDVAQTALAVAGQPTEPTLDGVNLMPFITGADKNAPHKNLYWRWGTLKAIRQGEWKLYRPGDGTMLFDMDVDKEEQNNLAEKHPDIVKKLTAEYDECNATLIPHRWGRQPGLKKNQPKPKKQ